MIRFLLNLPITMTRILLSFYDRERTQERKLLH